MAFFRGGLQNSVAEVRWEPIDHDLIGVLVPEEADPHAAAVFVASSADDVVLEKDPSCVAYGVVDEVGIVLLPCPRGR